ncbi:MAG: RNA polymerase sigma factor [Sphingobacteriia bacterium]|nr:RNA polymerase sigma factor [Sphingobacteriia bacterium]
MNNQELLTLCIKGNKQAQHLLYKQYAAQMLGVCYRYVKDIEDAEDILQEGFIKVFCNLHQFRNKGELGAWIRKIMVNTAITYIKKHNRYKKDILIDNIVLHPVSEENPEIGLDVKDIVETIRQIPSHYQLIFNLVAVEGYEYSEICVLLNMNLNTARSQYNRARAILIELLRKKESNIIKNHAGEI